MIITGLGLSGELNRSKGPIRVMQRSSESAIGAAVMVRWRCRASEVQSTGSSCTICLFTDKESVGS